MNVTLECPLCGYVRTVERDDVLRGTWHTNCPNCTSTQDDEEDASDGR